ncbi:PepSY domain-containing protein [Alteromonas sp. 1_MG-2023]|uniref:PepSY domain-containing protein n=1 Tax=Alteromonas sp. 1_MG-2023 TaxID=3062669 RepID=UPI0026E13A9C|nr:PepSY domain-containing protein [Alteromonas sp. 1_MG-2023]MDO6477315.1 PepSY domain-containing protein [Alteromonas sp. 1_MG-2023]
MQNAIKNFIIPATLILASAGASADNDDIRAFHEAKITLQQAIEAAVKHHGGQPFEASIDDDSFSPAYEVSVVKRSRVFDIRVDALSGEVTGIREDYDD